MNKRTSRLHSIILGALLAIAVAALVLRRLFGGEGGLATTFNQYRFVGSRCQFGFSDYCRAEARAAKRKNGWP